MTDYTHPGDEDYNLDAPLPPTDTDPDEDDPDEADGENNFIQLTVFVNDDGDMKLRMKWEFEDDFDEDLSNYCLVLLNGLAAAFRLDPGQFFDIAQQAIIFNGLHQQMVEAGKKPPQEAPDDIDDPKVTPFPGRWRH